MTTRWYEATLPATDAALYDMLRELFGIGTFDDIAGDNDRWHEARMREIAKIRATRRSRHVPLDAVAIAALYCHSHRIPITYASQLYTHIPTARRAWQQARAQHGDDAYDAAVEYERHQPDSVWLSRLLRATGQAHRQHTLSEWKKARGR